MSYFFFKHKGENESIAQRLVRFELLHEDNRPFALFRQGETVVEEPIMGYGQFEGTDGEQTIAPLILNLNNGQLDIICECCCDLVGVRPPVNIFDFSDDASDGNYILTDGDGASDKGDVSTDTE